MAGGRVHVGCSGWQYTHWRGDFYPAGLPQSRWFAHYALSFYQLPPHWPLNLERLETFLRTLPGAPESPPFRDLAPDVEAGLQTRLQHVIEFRDPSWYDDRVYALLEKHRVAPCLHDMQGSATGNIAVGPFIYVRFHFGQQKYGGAYDDDRLDAWGRWLSAQVAASRDVFAYFNNDTGGHAPKDAIRLRQRIQQRLAA